MSTSLQTVRDTLARARALVSKLEKQEQDLVQALTPERYEKGEFEDTVRDLLTDTPVRIKDLARSVGRSQQQTNNMLTFLCRLGHAKKVRGGYVRK